MEQIKVTGGKKYWDAYDLIVSGNIWIVQAAIILVAMLKTVKKEERVIS